MPTKIYEIGIEFSTKSSLIAHEIYARITAILQNYPHLFDPNHLPPLESFFSDDDDDDDDYDDESYPN